jgi:outer membrane protein assembly factor BamD
MRLLRAFPSLFLIVLLGLPSVAAASNWNPLNWFRSVEPSFDQRAATPEEIAAASAAFAEAERRRSIRQFRNIIRDYPFTEYAPRSLISKGEIYIARGNFRRGFRNWQRVITEYPQFEKFDEVIERQFELATALKEGKRGRLFFVFPGLRNPGLANTFFEVIIRNAPFSDYAPRSLYAIGEIGRERKQTEVAIDALDRLITFYPEHPLAEKGFFGLAEIYADLISGPHLDQGSTIEAIGYFEDFLILFPESPFVANAEEGLRDAVEVLSRNRLLMGEFYYRYRRNDTAALVFFNEAITVGPQTASAVVARERIAAIQAGGDRPQIGLRSLLPRFGRDRDDDRDAEIEARRAREFEEDNALIEPRM